LGLKIGKKFPQVFFASAGAWFVASVLLNDFAFSAMIALCFGVLLYFWLENKGKRLKRKKAKLVEKELPFALLSLSSELSYNPSFENALQNTAVQSYGLFSEGLRKALNEVKNSGASVQEALLHFSESFESTQLKRAVNQLIIAFEQGSGKSSAENLKKLGQELLARQRIESKEFNSKLAVLSLMFISLSAVMPALFQAFIIVGSAFLDLNFTPLEVLLVGIVAFPLVNVGVLFFVFESMPECLKE